MDSAALYLDVGGVLCPFGPEGPSDWGTDFVHAPIGLDGRHRPVLRCGERNGIHDWLKLEAIQRAIDRHSPARAVWIDHQLGFEEAAGAWTAMVGRGLLAISPKPRLGISRDHLHRFKVFLDTGVAETGERLGP